MKNNNNKPSTDRLEVCTAKRRVSGHLSVGNGDIQVSKRPYAEPSTDRLEACTAKRRVSGHLSVRTGHAPTHPLLALTPILVFLGIYLISSVCSGDFYKVPVTSAFLIASCYAVAISKGSIQERIKVFSEGASHKNILLMVWIFILAGAFAATARQTGAIDATVSLTLAIIPAQLLLVGMFLTACFVSMAIGTSVGTIVALVPIASGLAAQTGCSTAMMAALIVGGAFFGDNLSFISDTTIAATRAVSCPMNAKFKANLKIVIPAVIAVSAIYIILGGNVTAKADALTGSVTLLGLYKMLPYILVIVLAVIGIDVTAVLLIGIICNAIIGFTTGTMDWYTLLSTTGDGIAGMAELIVVTLLAGGMLGLIKQGGGLDYIMTHLMRHVHGRRGAEGGIALITVFANLCTANNTIAIITVGGLSKDIADKFSVEPRRAASIMDTASCFVQGLIPYGVQLLMASGLTGVSSLEIIPHLYYQFAIGLCLLVSILLPSRKPVSPSAGH